jgi:hypothetical protein
MTAAQHWREAEAFARAAGEAADPAESKRLGRLAYLHIAFAEALDRIARERDVYGREPVGEDMAGAPRPGDIWVDGQDAKWLYEDSDRLVSLGGGRGEAAWSGTFDEIRAQRGFLRLEYRTRLPLDDVYGSECPF